MSDINKEKDFFNLSSLDLAPNYIDDFIEYYSEIMKYNSNVGEPIKDVNIDSDEKNQKEELYFYYALPEEAEIITVIINDAFNNYPFLEMVDVENVRNLIISKNSCVFVFKSKANEVVGTISFDLDFQSKKGYVRSLAIYKKYRGKLDITNINISIYVHMYKKYKDRILVWYGESLLSGIKSQHITYLCHLKPIGLLPNKDIFSNQIMSEFLIIAYDRKALKDYRSKKTPKIIIEVMKSFIYASLKYDLTMIDCIEPKLHLEKKKIIDLNREYKLERSNNKYGYISVKMFFKNSDSYFKFLYTPQHENIIKIEYKISFLEEFSVFLDKLNKFMKNNDVRYCEFYISAYEPLQQKLISLLGFKPRGYVPSWKIDKVSGLFEDYILFNKSIEEIDNNFNGEKDYNLVLNHFIDY